MNYLKYIIITIFNLQLSYYSKAQNLVLNPSFEDTIKCPIGFKIDSSAYFWTEPINHGSSPDHFHTCNGNINSSIPNNKFGNQDTCTGQSYSGYTIFHNSSNGREYLTGKLVQPLLTNQCYKLTFKYSLAELNSYYSISNFGIYFSNLIPDANGSLVLTFTPQIIVNQWMDDWGNWTKIERYFVAQGGEQYLTLGNFEDYTTTPTKIALLSSLFFESTIYLDDIHVEAVPTLSLPQINLGADTILCKGQELVFDSLIPTHPIYVWNNLVESTDSSFVIDTTGTYWVEAYNGCSYTTDTIHVEFVEPNISLGNDTTLCKRQQLQIAANYYHSKAEYLWSSSLPAFGTEITPQIIAQDSGLHSLKVKVGGCQDADSILVKHQIPNSSILINKNIDTTLCVNGKLEAPLTVWNENYVWNTNGLPTFGTETTQSITVSETGIYTVYTENECTESTSTFDVTIEQIEEGFNPINIFTPNGDGFNDYFTLYTGTSTDYNLQIFNRWGKLIWVSSDTGNNSNSGNYWNAEGINDGVYYYHLQFTNCADELVNKKGFVEVRR